MAKNFEQMSFVLEDEIVLDGIRAINYLKKQTGRVAYVSGGMAVSSYFICPWIHIDTLLT